MRGSLLVFLLILLFTGAIFKLILEAGLIEPVVWLLACVAGAVALTFFLLGVARRT